MSEILLFPGIEDITFFCSYKTKFMEIHIERDVRLYDNNYLFKK